MSSRPEALADSGPQISVVVVNLDGRHHLEILLASLAEQTLPSREFEIIVVDNGSNDDSVTFLREHHSCVRIVENRDNEGFARPNNQAAAVARGKYLALINNDMRLAPDWLSRMAGYLSAAPDDVVCAGSRILSWDGRTVDFAGAALGFHGMGFQPGFGTAIEEVAADYPTELLFACGGAMLIDRQVYLDAGGFDEDYFAYYEDVDLGWRLWVMGYRVGFCPHAVAYHLHNGTSSRFPAPPKLLLMERNALYSVVKNYGDEALARILPAALLLAGKRAAMRSASPRDRYSFAPATRNPPPDPRVAGGNRVVGLLGKALQAWRQGGIRLLARKAVHKLSGLRPSSRVAGTDGLPGGADAAFATAHALGDVGAALPALFEKRRSIQSRRRRPDAEILKRFGMPFQPVMPGEDYERVQRGLVGALDIADLFREEAPAPVAAGDGGTQP